MEKEDGSWSLWTQTPVWLSKKRRSSLRFSSPMSLPHRNGSRWFQNEKLFTIKSRTSHFLPHHKSLQLGRKASVKKQCRKCRWNEPLRLQFFFTINWLACSCSTVLKKKTLRIYFQLATKVNTSCCPVEKKRDEKYCIYILIVILWLVEQTFAAPFLFSWQIDLSFWKNKLHTSISNYLSTVLLAQQEKGRDEK